MNKLASLWQGNNGLIQSPMAGVQDATLAIAVSNAGGLGSLPCAMLSPQMLREQLTKIRGGTSQPFNVNFFVHAQPTEDAARERMWRDVLRPFYDELGLDGTAISAGAQRLPFNEESMAILEEFRPPIVSFHFGLPSEDLMARVRRTGAKIFSSATTITEALWLEARGVDAVIAQGFEAGGHRGIFLHDDLATQLGTFALLPQVKDAVKIPVIAAGGIVDARGIQAARALGADGVQIGTAYLLCPEATTSVIHRNALKSSANNYTALTNIFTGRPARGLMNRLMEAIGPLTEAAPTFPLAAGAVSPLRQFSEKNGSTDFLPLWAGQNTSQCREASATELTHEFCAALT